MMAKGNTLVVDVRDAPELERAARSPARRIPRAACWNSEPTPSSPYYDKSFARDKTIIILRFRRSLCARWEGAQRYKRWPRVHGVSGVGPTPHRRCRPNP